MNVVDNWYKYTNTNFFNKINIYINKVIYLFNNLQ